MRLLHRLDRRQAGKILRARDRERRRPQKPHPLQQAFLEEQAGQCGYCLSGILISAKALLDHNPSPSRAEIARALDDNICRCGAHNRILRAVEKAAARLSESRRP
jgi:nicotinate dehydrogenase subunit A